MFTAVSISRRGFTLIEMLVVVVVIAILAAIVLPVFQSRSRRSREVALKSDLAQLRSSVATFQADTGCYPKALLDLTAVSTTWVSGAYDASGTAQTVAASDFHGPYIQGAFGVGSVTQDPVSGSAFNYSVAYPNVGKITSSATGNDLNGVPFSSY